MTKEYSMSRSQIAYDLQKRLDLGSIIHVGWNKYSVQAKKRIYNHRYSSIAEDIVKKIDANYVE